MLNKLESYMEIIKKSGLCKKGLYLCSCFAIDDDWQIDFYSKKTKTITSFKIKGSQPEILNENSKIFQQEKVDLEELNLKKVKVDLPEVIQTAEKIRQAFCPSEKISKTIQILQTLKKIQLWNITYLTSAFNVLNIKINAKTGDVMHKTFQPAFSFRQK